MKHTKTWLVLGTAAVLMALLPPQEKISKRKFIDPQNMDRSVSPAENFYLYANGNWLKNNPIPASKTSWGSFNVLREASLQRLQALLTEAAAANAPKGSLEQRIGDYYASGMDSLTIEHLGYQPILANLERIRAIQDLHGIIAEVATVRTTGMATPLFNFFVAQDRKNPARYICQFSQGGTTLPDRDYYLKDDARSKAIREEYLKHISKMFRLIDMDEKTANQCATTILHLETTLAGAQMSRVELRDPYKTYNKFRVDDFSKTTPHLQWRSLMALMKASHQDSVLVAQPHFYQTVDSLLAAVPVDDWKTYLQWNVLKNAAPYLSNAFVQENFAFTRVLTGQKEMTPRWQRISSLIDGQLGDLLGQLYVKKYFRPEAKQRMIQLVQNLQNTFENRIRRLDWMSDATKQKALNKLKAFGKKIGYPDKWKNYEGVVINRDDFMGNMLSCSRWAYNYMVNRLGRPVDKTEWNMTPPTINAYYSPVNNEIAFPAGILQFPFFDFEADDAVNYGGIGAVIGHEMTHGFDDQGRQYDADGSLHDWWSKEDAEQFKKRADIVVRQYDAFQVDGPNGKVNVNGRLTLGENLADLGGLSIAYEAFKNTPQGRSSQKIDGFTPDQRFFLSWAQVWRINVLKETAEQLVKTDPHSPGMYRCNAPLSNMVEFYKAFDVKPGNAMWRADSIRVRIW